MTDIVQQMSKADAQQCVKQIREHAENIREAALRLHEERGWAALGYDSWRECIKAEFGKGQSQVYRLLENAKVVRAIKNSPIGENSPMGEKVVPAKESQTRELSALPESEQPAAWSEAVESADGKQPTAKQVKEVVEKRAKPEPGPLDGLLASVRDAIEQAEAFRELMNAITQVKSKVRKIIESPLGRHINPQELNAHLTNAFRILKFAMPFADCVYCGRTIKKTCKACGGQGWLVQDVFNQAPADMKANSVVRKAER